MTPTNEKMLVENRVIKRGEVYYANLDDAQGHEQKNDKDSERRSVVVVSNNKQNEHSKVVVIVPLSSKVHNLRPSFQAPTYFPRKTWQSQMRTSASSGRGKIAGRKARQSNRGRNGKEVFKKLSITLISQLLCQKKCLFIQFKIKKIVEDIL